MATKNTSKDNKAKETADLRMTQYKETNVDGIIVPNFAEELEPTAFFPELPEDTTDSVDNEALIEVLKKIGTKSQVWQLFKKTVESVNQAQEVKVSADQLGAIYWITLADEGRQLLRTLIEALEVYRTDIERKYREDFPVIYAKFDADEQVKIQTKAAKAKTAKGKEVSSADDAVSSKKKAGLLLSKEAAEVVANAIRIGIFTKLSRMNPKTSVGEALLEATTVVEEWRDAQVKAFEAGEEQPTTGVPAHDAALNKASEMKKAPAKPTAKAGGKKGVAATAGKKPSAKAAAEDIDE